MPVAAGAPTTTRDMLNKVPEVTFAFWTRKILATTVGETGADYLAGLPARAAGWTGAALRWGQRLAGTGVAPSGSPAFDAHRAETLRKLAGGQREFQAFVARLSQARDRSEFDAFMAERAR